MTAAKAFSASSYSNECSMASAMSNSSFTFPEHDVSNETAPSFLSAGPQKMVLPFLRFMALMASAPGPLLGPAQPVRVARKTQESHRDNNSNFFMLIVFERSVLI